MDGWWGGGRMKGVPRSLGPTGTRIPQLPSSQRREMGANRMPGPCVPPGTPGIAEPPPAQVQVASVEEAGPELDSAGARPREVGRLASVGAGLQTGSAWDARGRSREAAGPAPGGLATAAPPHLVRHSRQGHAGPSPPLQAVRPQAT